MKTYRNKKCLHGDRWSDHYLNLKFDFSEPVLHTIITKVITDSPWPAIPAVDLSYRIVEALKKA